MITASLTIIAVFFGFLTAELKTSILWPICALISLGCLVASVWRSLL